jgi:hypothetical protein
MSDRVLSIGGIVVGLITTGLGFLIPTRWIGGGCIAAGLLLAVISATWAIASRRHRSLAVIVKPEPPPNIQRLQSDLIKVQQTGGRFDASPTGRDAAVVEFGNEPSASKLIGALYDVDAQIFYWAEGSLLHRTHHGFWLAQESPLAQFPPSANRKLLLAIIDADLTVVAIDNTDAFTPFHLPQEEILRENVLNIEVQLTAGEHAEWIRCYMFKLRVEPRAITYDDDESS